MLVHQVICFLFIDGYSGLSGVSLFITVLLVGLINTFERYFEQIREKAFLVVIFILCKLCSFYFQRFTGNREPYGRALSLSGLEVDGTLHPLDQLLTDAQSQSRTVVGSCHEAFKDMIDG